MAVDYSYKSKFDAEIARNNEKKEEDHGEEAQDWTDNISAEVDYIIPFPGLARDIQKWILNTSTYPQPAISYAATMSILGTVTGRYIAYDNIKGNLMFLCMAESGEGKDYPFKAAKRILDASGFGRSVIGRCASGAAFMEALQESPSMLFHIDEFGNYLSSINGKNSNQYSKEIVDILTETYTSCDSEFEGKRLKGMEPPRVKEPNVSIFGLSTERQVFDGLRTSDLANGSLARYSLLFGINGQMPLRTPRDKNVPKNIIDGIKSLHEKNEIKLFLKSRQLEISQAYDDEKFRLQSHLKKLSINLSRTDKSGFIPIYNRILVRAVQQAMLIDECSDIGVLNWFVDLEIKSVDIFIKKFMHLGFDSENGKQVSIIEKAIKEAGKNGITKTAFYNRTRDVDPRLKERIIKELIESNKIFIKDGDKGKAGFAPLIYYWKK